MKVLRIEKQHLNFENLENQDSRLRQTRLGVHRTLWNHPFYDSRVRRKIICLIPPTSLQIFPRKGANSSKVSNDTGYNPSREIHSSFKIWQRKSLHKRLNITSKNKLCNSFHYPKYFTASKFPDEACFVACHDEVAETPPRLRMVFLTLAFTADGCVEHSPNC